MLSERLNTFGAAALNARLPVPEGLTGPDGLPSERRFAVYRNNVVVGLVGALKAAYPVVHRLVGEDFFRVMGTYFVRRDPPSSPILLHYGESFPDFLAIFEPVAHLPWLTDVARLERARLEAWHASEAPPADLSAADSSRFGQLRLTLHPSLRVVTSRFAARTIWQANLLPELPQGIDPTGPEDTLFLRPEAQILALPLAPGGAAFLRALQSGRPVMAAALDGIAETSRFDMAATLSLLFANRAVIALTDKEPVHAH